MSETALIVPVPQAEASVSRFREKYDASAAVGVPAHVTLLHPFLAPDEIGAGDVDALTRLFASVRAFDVVFARCGRFAPWSLWLAPAPSGPFVELTRRIVARWPGRPPYAGAIPLDRIVPHLTVCDGAAADVLDRTEAELAPALPVRARVAEAQWIENRGGRWTLRGRFALGG